MRRAESADGSDDPAAGSSAEAARNRSRRRRNRARRDAPAEVALVPGYLAQLFAQTGIDPRSPDAFDQAARAYRRFQGLAAPGLFVDPPAPVDFDA